MGLRKVCGLNTFASVGEKKIKEKTNARTLLLIIMYWGKPKINLFYCIDTSVLLENIPLATFIKTTSGT